ncbi:MAG: GAF domain-containing protein, partial [Magnetococcales bacterium]|nr:GAF domain-containing protein [Magnetococcales bacterium]
MPLQPELLSQILVFRGVDSRELAQFLGECPLLDTGAGHVLLDPNHPSSNMYVVLSGILGVHLGHEAIGERIKTITTGGSVGEMSLMRRLPPSAYVMAVEPSRLLVIDEALFWPLLERFPLVALNLIRMLSDWLGESSDLLLERQNRLIRRSQELAWEHAKLEHMVRLGISLSGERDEATLLELFLNGAMEVSGADGGVLYVCTQEKKLEFRIVRANSLGIHLGGKGTYPPPFPSLLMYDTPHGQPNHAHVATHVAHLRQVVNVADVYAAQEFDYSSMHRFDKLTGYQTRSLLVVPLISRRGEILGILQLFNAHDSQSGAIVPFSMDIQKFIEAVAAQAAISIEVQNLVVSQGQLMDAFIEMLVAAIDAKSPYTGGHCSRVPELARMLAEATCAQKDGPLADFALTTDEEWHEFKVASLLHDCGKVITPDTIVDKATKLEAVYNRIHEVRTRFEVLWRDAEVSYWRRRALEAPSPEQLVTMEQELAATRQTLQEEFAFVAECNVGSEFMGSAAQKRLREIASRRWVRHFDHTLGLSHEELRLHPPPHDRTPPPVEESLLVDRPEHVVLR